MADNVIDKEASLLFKDRKITERYQELVDRAATASVMTAQERLEYLTEIIQGIEQEHGVAVTKDGVVEYDAPADLNTRLKAIDLMNKMQGEYTTKIEGELKVTKLEDLI
jgi:hypothetical protein